MPKSKKEKPEKKVKASGKGVKMADMSEGAVIIDEAKLEEQLKEEIKTPEVSAEEKVQAKAPVKPPKTRGKKYQNAKSMVDKNKSYLIKEALGLLKKINEDAKFKQTLEIHLNVLTKGLSGEVSLPYFKGKQRKIVIFDDKLFEEIKAGKVNFDVLLATPTDMPRILPLAKVLGPKGLMPNPKNGSVSPDPKKAMEKFSSGAVVFKTEKDFPLIHTSFGKINQPEEELIANFEAFIKAVQPKNITKAIIKTTMSPGIKILIS